MAVSRSSPCVVIAAAVGIVVFAVWLFPPQPMAVPKVCAAAAPEFILTPALPGETPLQKWKRTKADYESQSKVVRELTSQMERQYYPALEAYLSAEKELQSAQCGKVCFPEKVP